MVMADFLIPLAVMLITNTLILSLMTVLDPVTYGIISNETSDIDLTYESCIFTKSQRHKFWIPLVCWNISVLVFSLHQSWSVRNRDVEVSFSFPSEAPQIFNALLSSLLVALMGILIMLMVRDRGDPITAALVDATLSFVFCILVLFTIFATKIKHVWKTNNPRHQETMNIDCSQQPDGNSPDSELPQGKHRVSLSAHSRTKEELKVENHGLRKRTLELEEELLLYPTSGRSKNKILKNFFGILLGNGDDFQDECSLTSIKEQRQEHPQRVQEEQTPVFTSPSPKAPSFGFKKIFEDIFFESSDVIPSYSPGVHPITISAETTSLDLSREFRSLKSILKSSTSTSNNNGYYNSGTIYKTTTATTATIATTTTSNKGSPKSKSSPTTKSDILPPRSSFYKSATLRGPELEDHSTSPLEKKESSPGGSMVPLGGSPPTPMETMISRSTNPQPKNVFGSSFDSITAPLDDPKKPNNVQSSFGSSTAPLGNPRPRCKFQPSFDSMVSLGDPSLPGTSLSTGMSKSIFRPKFLSGGLGPSIPEGDGLKGIPSQIIICHFDVLADNNDKKDETAFGQQIPQSESSVSASALPAAPRRPSLGEDMGTPKDPRNPFRYCV